MAAPSSVKDWEQRTSLVGVIASPSDLARALRLRRPPDFFELRLDSLWPFGAEMERQTTRLQRPLIITARHPLEGGQNALSSGKRRGLLLRHLPRAAFVDVELRSALPLSTVLEAAATRNVKRIISCHDLTGTPSVRALEEFARRAEALSPDLLKIVTKTDRAEDVARLVKFLKCPGTRRPLCVMGIGRFGRKSRVIMTQSGSCLHYVHLGTAVVPGQFSLAEARRLDLRTA